MLVVGGSIGLKNYSSDISAFHLLPVYNTKLLRTYSEVAPPLCGLIIAIKRWAKEHGLAQTWENYISSYSWTLMVIFYLQVKHDLPSLHQLYAPQDSNALKKSNYAFNFLDKIAQMEHSANLQSLRCQTLGDLFRGFFRYFSEEFQWDKEVVSIRLGFPACKGENFHRKLFQNVYKREAKETLKWLNIEDPIEVHRNLNFALTEEHAVEIMDAIRQTHMDLQAGASLSSVLTDSAQLISETLDEAYQYDEYMKSERRLDGFLPYPDLGPRQDCRCHRCQRDFPTYQALMKHQGPPMRCSYPFRCSCGKGFVRKADLEAHLRSMETNVAPHGQLRHDMRNVKCGGQRRRGGRDLFRHGWASSSCLGKWMDMVQR